MRVPLILVKIFKYEYWPWWLFYLPLTPYWLYLAVRAKSLTFFTSANPAIEAGGFYGESKVDILNKISADYLPKMLYVEVPIPFLENLQYFDKQGFEYPFIAKPNVGERGFMVTKIENQKQFLDYHQAATYPYIIQDFIDYPVELGLLFSKLPNDQNGIISSITMKEFLTVTGDGRSTILELILQSTRSRFQLEVLQHKLGKGISRILNKDEKLLLEPIGNHCKGTKFINVNHLINSQLNEVLNKIATTIDGFYYGRFDMRVSSIEDLYAGKNIKILELNGVSSDPGHIYDPSYRLWKAYRDLMWHWRRVADISIQNQKRGIAPLPLSKVIGIVKQHFA